MVIGKLREYANKYPVHITICCHPRKPPAGGNRKLSEYDLVGHAKSIQEADNVIILQRLFTFCLQDSIILYREEVKTDSEVIYRDYIDVKKSRSGNMGPNSIFKVFFDRNTKCYSTKLTNPNPEVRMEHIMQLVYNLFKGYIQTSGNE